MKPLILLVLLLAVALPSSASWKLSLAVLGASQAADIHSSLGGMERNPRLRGPDGRFLAGKAIAIKSVIVAGMIAGQWAFQRIPGRRKLRKPFIIINFAAAGAITVVAIHNYGVE